jgi:hypothetical protein
MAENTPTRLARAFVRGFARGYAHQPAFGDVPTAELRRRLFEICKSARTGLDGADQIADPQRRAAYLRDALERILQVGTGAEE